MQVLKLLPFTVLFFVVSAVALVIAGTSTLPTGMLNQASATDVSRKSEYLTLMCGEISQQGVILQARFNEVLPLTPGAKVQERMKFQLSADKNFRNPLESEWIEAAATNDYIVRYAFSGLTPATEYHYRVVVRGGKGKRFTSPLASFQTLPDTASAEPVSFVVSSCMHYERFYGEATPQHKEPARPLPGNERAGGYPGLKAIAGIRPLFWIANGDNVYYDHPAESRAQTVEAMRAKWRRQMQMPNLRRLLLTTPVFWLKDDHDFRYDDADTISGMAPAFRDGVNIFREQLPVGDPAADETVTYRTIRVNKHLQFWLLEGRDYRSPNAMEDGPEKSMWGAKQREWLKQTLQASTATFKLIVSPTPMVGPDDARKSDNHTNEKGFRYEGDSFFNWLKESNLSEQNIFIICGDRHWQYHARHPFGYEEFSVGSLIYENARGGRKAGDPLSTDPAGNIQQFYLQDKPYGGFLIVDILMDDQQKKPVLKFSFSDENGQLIYAVEKRTG